MADEERRKLSPLAKLGLDLGPILLFFGATATLGILPATAVFMAALCVALAIGYAIERKLEKIPLITAVFVLLLGGLTLALGDSTFVKIKPTVVYLLFTAVLVGGLLFNRLYIKFLLSTALELPDPAWRTLTWRMAAYFFVLAIANEIVWRNFSDTTWAGFKLGLVFLTFVFMAAQVPFIMRHQIDAAKPPSG
jgi:intracellular septation protein